MDALSKAALIGSLLAMLGSSPGAQAAGQPPAPTAKPPRIDFGKHDVGARTAPVAVRIDNPTDADLELARVSIPSDFTLDPGGCREPIAPRGWCTVAVRFSPLAAGVRAGELRVEYLAGMDKIAASLSVVLTGTGESPQLSVSPARLSFPRQGSGGRDARQAISLTNHAGGPLTIRGVTVSGEFSVSAPTLPHRLAPGATLVLPVWRRPGAGPEPGAVAVLSDARESPQVVSLDVAGGGLPWVFPADRVADLAFAGMLCLLYWSAMVTVRWHRVAMETRGDLRGQIDAVAAELRTIKPSGGSASAAAAEELLKKAGELLDGPKDRSGNQALNILFWSRGQEINGWGYVHEAQLRMVPLMDDETVRARLEGAEQRLRLANEICATELADAVHRALTADPKPSADRLKALLTQALAMTYGHEDNVFSSLVSWQNKASWLVICGLAAIVALTAVFPQQAILLVVGAAGGLISRLSRSLDRKDVPTDYGASWTTLFLSPVAGAVGAWAGIMIASLAASAKILGPIFQGEWAHPAGVGTLGLALLFGFSERLLDSVLDKLEGQAAAPGTAQSTLAIVDPKLVDGKVGTLYPEQQLQATGAAGEVRWSLASGSGPLPDGLRLDATGKLSGTPQKQGTFPFAVEAFDQKTKATRTLTLKID